METLQTHLHGEQAGEQIILKMIPWKLPSLEVTTNGVTYYKTVGYHQLLELLDHSSVVQQLRQSPHRYMSLPQLPERTLFIDTDEYAQFYDVIVTGWVPKTKYPFIYKGESYMISVPTMVYQIRWRSNQQVMNFRLCVTTDDVVTADSPLYRWPFSNVLSNENVCWTAQGLKTELHEVVKKCVFGFLQTPNNTDGYGISHSHNSSYTQYQDFLKAVEENNGVHPDWLIPLTKTVKEFHDNN